MPIDTYQPPRHIGVRNVSTKASDADVAFWVDAVRQQLVVAAGAWELPAPNVVLYDRELQISRDEASVVNIVDDGGVPDAAGYHNPFAGTVDMRRSDKPEVTLSHEVLEMFGNLYLTRWFRGPKGLWYAGELSDCVQEQSYRLAAQVGGQMRYVEVANFALPARFTEGAQGPYDHLGVLFRPFQIAEGGYEVAMDAANNTVMLAHQQGAFFAASKLQPYSRTHRLITGAVKPAAAG